MPIFKIGYKKIVKSAHKKSTPTIKIRWIFQIRCPIFLQTKVIFSGPILIFTVVIVLFKNRVEA